MRFDDLLCPINFSMARSKVRRCIPVGLGDVIADSSLAANFPAQGEGSGQRAITRRFALTGVSEPIAFRQANVEPLTTDGVSRRFRQCAGR